MTDRIEPIGPRRGAAPVEPVRLRPAEREERKQERERRRRGRAAGPPEPRREDGDAPPRLDLRA